MAKAQLVKGTTSYLTDIFIQNNSLTTGAGLTGLVFNTASLTAYYHRSNSATATAISLATMTAGTWATAGFVEVDATNMPGVYQIGIPNAALASGAGNVSILLKGATNMAPVVLEIELTGTDNQDAVHGGMTALPNAAATASGGLPTIGTGAGQIAITVNGMVDSNVVDWKGSTAPAMTGDAYARLGAPAGASVSADVAAVKAVLPAALVGGRMDSSIGAVANGAIVAASFAAGALDAVWSTATRLLTAGTNIVLAKGTGVTGFNDLDAAGVRSAVGMSAANLDTQLAAIDVDVLTRLASASYTTPPTANQNADALLGRNIAGGSTGGRTVTQALRFLRNKWAIVAGTGTVYQEDDATPDWTFVPSTDAAALPITGNDPS